MNKKRFILQWNFRGITNGYCQHNDSDYGTCVNREFVGLYLRAWTDELIYHIR